ncbi:hypothetical protein [Undibacter mobilis]|uniref:YXWGXW repeat-containing protein n=1 Tax=Undibacter mobilis TaxID=2292256 RepID=A0A371BDA5_9BRAD|nr:hypothetical protein [Undibacter mobilis]RDV05528.1 hypothetical protein DXH78_13670 [Undibacter mobilis]
MRLALAGLAALLLAASPALASSASSDPSAQTVPKPAKKHVTKRHIPRGTGFLPGYRTPAQIERDRYMEIQRERRAYYRAGGPRIAYWGYSDPRFYRGRWNGGSFGPCWTTTPIGYQWNCGK